MTDKPRKAKAMMDVESPPTTLREDVNDMAQALEDVGHAVSAYEVSVLLRKAETELEESAKIEERLRLAVEAFQELYNVSNSSLVYEIVDNALKAIGPLDTEPDKTEAAESVEAAMRISRNKWRAFSTNEDGGCHETPDEVYATAFEDGSKYTALLSADSESINPSEPHSITLARLKREYAKSGELLESRNRAWERIKKLVAEVAELEQHLVEANFNRKCYKDSAAALRVNADKTATRISELESEIARLKQSK